MHDAKIMFRVDGKFFVTTFVNCQKQEKLHSCLLSVGLFHQKLFQWKFTLQSSTFLRSRTFPSLQSSSKRFIKFLPRHQAIDFVLKWVEFVIKRMTCFSFKKQLQIAFSIVQFSQRLAGNRFRARKSFYEAEFCESGSFCRDQNKIFYSPNWPSATQKRAVIKFLHAIECTDD